MNNHEKKLQDIIISQRKEIERLKKQLEDRENIVYITESYQEKLKDRLKEADEKLNECHAIRQEIAEMKNAYDKAVFNGRWNILRHFL